MPHVRGIAAACLLAVAMPAGAVQDASGREIHQITVTGTGSASAEPDMALVTFGVDIPAADPVVAVSDAADAIESALEAAERMGIEDEDLSTTSYSLWMESVYDPVTYEYTGEVLYHVTHNLSARIRDLDEVGRILAGLVEAGATTVSGVVFTVEDRVALYDEAREAATADALRRATLLAGQTGLVLGRPSYVSEYAYDYGYSEYAGLEADLCRAGGGYSAPSISAGTFTVTTSVSITYDAE